MALVLCIETSQDICSVALGDQNGLIDYISSQEIRSHGKNLTIIIDDILKANKLSISQLDFIALSIGPGSYTGLRIGTSVAKGISYANDTPIITLNSLEIMVHEAVSFQHLSYDNYYPMIDARRMEVYSASFNSKLDCLQESRSLVLTDIDFSSQFNIENSIFIGSGAEKLHEINFQTVEPKINSNISATARAMVTPSKVKIQKMEFANTAYFEPFYLKPFYTNATLKK